MQSLTQSHTAIYESLYTADRPETPQHPTLKSKLLSMALKTLHQSPPSLGGDYYGIF